MESVVVVHIGAGRHSPKHTPALKKLLRGALAQASLRGAAGVVERSPLTNTGRGSSLDRRGAATADSCILRAADGRVADALALVGIDDAPQPTAAAFHALAWLDAEFTANTVSHSLGLSKPSVLDYRAFREHTCASTGASAKASMVSKQARRDLDLFTEYLQMGNLSASDLGSRPAVQDTVGCLEVAGGQTFTIASSSGGNFYKIPGRISCAGVPGAAIAYSSFGDVSVGCMCTGNGDDIINMGLASYVSDGLAEWLSEKTAEGWPELGPYLVERILRRSRSVKLTAVNADLAPIVYVGVIAVVQVHSEARLVYCHSTETFYFGFRSKSRETVLSRLEGPVGTFVHGEYKLS